MYKTKIININGVPSQVIEYPQEQTQVIYNNQIPQTQIISFEQEPTRNQQNFMNPYQQNNGFHQNASFQQNQMINQVPQLINQSAPQMLYTENEIRNEYDNEQDSSIFDEQYCSETKEKLKTVKFLFETREIDYEQYLKWTKKLVVEDLEKNK
ncbi:MAG: hypothetical protein ACRDA7_00270 [Metamycoplasmataceae bacterium]